MEYAFKNDEEITRVAETRVPYLTRSRREESMANKREIHHFWGTSTTSGRTVDFFAKALENFLKASETPRLGFYFIVRKFDPDWQIRQTPIDAKNDITSSEEEPSGKTPARQEGLKSSSLQEHIDVEDDIIVQLPPRDNLKVMAEIKYVIKAKPKVVVDFYDLEENF